MGKIFCIMGKSSSGKDTLYKRILEDKSLGLKHIVPYTTRPLRNGEKDGMEYHFVSEEQLEELYAAGKVIELRAYQTVYGIWKYFTVNDGQFDLDQKNFLMIATLESYEKIRDYFGKKAVVPVYVEVEDGVRLQRAMDREKSEREPKYAELCRRFLADTEDFSEEKLQTAGIGKRFQNENLDCTCEEITAYIRSEMTSENI